MTTLNLLFFQMTNIRKAAEDRLSRETNCTWSWSTRLFSILFIFIWLWVNMWYEDCFNFLMSFSFWKRMSMYTEYALSRSDQKLDVDSWEIAELLLCIQNFSDQKCLNQNESVMNHNWFEMINFMKLWDLNFLMIY